MFFSSGVDQESGEHQGARKVVPFVNQSLKSIDLNSLSLHASWCRMYLYEMSLLDFTYVCIYIYIYVYTYIDMHIHYIYIYNYMCLHIHIHIYIYIYIYIYVYIYYIYIYIHTYRLIHTFPNLHHFHAIAFLPAAGSDGPSGVDHRRGLGEADMSWMVFPIFHAGILVRFIVIMLDFHGDSHSDFCFLFWIFVILMDIHGYWWYS